MATLFLIGYGLWLLAKDLFCKKQETPSAQPTKNKNDSICEFSQDEILEFEELIELDKD